MYEFIIPMVVKQESDLSIHDNTTKPAQSPQDMAQLESFSQKNDPSTLVHAHDVDEMELDDIAADDLTDLSVLPTTSKTQYLEAQVDAEYAGLRLDFVAAQLFSQFSRERLKKWIEQGFLTVNGKQVKAKTQMQGGEALALQVQLEEEVSLQPQDISLNVVYEDDDIIVINKPVGLVVHPGAGNWTGTLVNGLLFHSPALSELPRAGLVHRIDKDTSGLLVVAKNLEAQYHLTQQLQNKSVYRVYDAVVMGQMITGGKVDQPIKRHPQDRLKMAVQAGGKPSVTHYKIKERFIAHTLLRVQLETGRTHQIRVHMSHIGHALVGDPVYAGRQRLPKGATPDLIEFLNQFKRQALHARQLGLIHPKTGQKMMFEAPWPDDFVALVDALTVDRAVQLMDLER